MTPPPRRGESIPTTRPQAEALLAAIDYDESRLTLDQVRAIREIYGLPAGGEEAPGA